MPGYNYAEEMRPWTAAAGDVSRALTHLPVLRAQIARQRQQDEESSFVRKAQIENYAAETSKRNAETGKVNEETKRLAAIGAATERLGQKFPVLVEALRTGDFNNPAATEAMGDMAMITGENKDDLAALVRNLASAQTVSKAGVNVSPEQVRFAGALQNPVSIANQDARIAGADRRAVAKPDPEEFETVTEHYPEVPATEGTPGVEGRPAVKRSRLGLDWLAKDDPEVKAVAAVPGIPGTPKRTVSYKRRRGAGEVPFGEQSQDPNDSEYEDGSMMEDGQAAPEPVTQTATNAPAVKTVAGTRPKARTQADVDYAIKQANDAINGVGDYAGKPRDPETVKRMLQEMGIVLK